MRTFTLLKGLPVYNSKTGKALGVIDDLQLSSDGMIQAIVVDVKGLFGRDRHIPVQNVLSFGQDGVMINDFQVQHTGFDKSSHYLCHQHGLLGQLIYTAEGEKLGIVEDVYFDENLGTILGYEVSVGFFADLSEGKRVIKSNTPLQYGEDIILIDLD
ncbi:PRC-barrel domain-containing protein [Bacillus sp. DJP31]|uniref:PRC-barrel domain-containing protein n=1 Tax=Bacillus sp. DJP31 TaxID=3409789 RepID=UPI003BB5D810